MRRPTTATATLIPSATALPPSATPLPSAPATITRTPTVTATPTITPTPTITLTPTFAFPKVEVILDAAHCRYGPNQAYLHAADLYKGDRGEVPAAGTSRWCGCRYDKHT